jgi:uncharacterized coiled-coil DUF342 family protein
MSLRASPAVVGLLISVSLVGCANLEPTVKRLEEQVTRLELSSSEATRLLAATQREITTLRGQIAAMQANEKQVTDRTQAELLRLHQWEVYFRNEIQRLSPLASEAKRKLDTFCVVTRGSRWDRFKPQGDPECNIP